MKYNITNAKKANFEKVFDILAYELEQNHKNIWEPAKDNDDSTDKSKQQRKVYAKTKIQ